MILLILACAQAGADTYRWVDNTGQVHYSDRPTEGATKVQLGNAQTYQQPRRSTPPPVTRQDAAATPDTASPYTSLRVVRPAPEETYRNIGGQLLVTLSLNPGLRAGHSVRVYYDGGRVESWPASMLSATITNVYRGEHNLRAAVVDGTGKELASSETNTFFVHQTSVYNRARN